MFEWLSFSEPTFSSFASLVENYQYTVALLAPLTIGEVALFFFGVLIGAGTLSFGPLFVGLGVIIFYDVCILLFARWLKTTRCAQKMYLSFPFFKRTSALVDRYVADYATQPLLMLFLLKVLPLTKITIFFYSMKYSLPLRTFILRDIIATSMWASIIFIPGVLVGKEFFSYESGQTISTLIGLFVIFLIFMNFLERYIVRSIKVFFKKKKKRSERKEKDTTSSL